jgi:VIT1/CCC1 family predicted Fe2+/Mn2+ transporter
MTDDFSELKKVISKSAPLLGAIMSSVNPLAGFVIANIAQLFGGHYQDGAQSIIDKINNDSDAEAKLKTLEIQYQETLSVNSMEDKGSARGREEKITEILKKRDYVMEGIAVAVVVGYFAMCCLTVFYSIPLADHDMLNMLFGQLMGGFMMVLSYYFGSSNK